MTIKIMGTSFTLRASGPITSYCLDTEMVLPLETKPRIDVKPNQALFSARLKMLETSGDSSCLSQLIFGDANHGAHKPFRTQLASVPKLTPTRLRPTLIAEPLLLPEAFIMR